MKLILHFVTKPNSKLQLCTMEKLILMEKSSSGSLKNLTVKYISLGGRDGSRILIE